MTIYIGNLSYEAQEQDIRHVFEDYGAVLRVTVPVDRETGRIRGFAFVDLAEPANEDEAIQNLHDAEWMGRKLRVNKAKPRESNPSSAAGGHRSSVVHNPL
jgi:RNA recognition motif-containing protein